MLNTVFVKWFDIFFLLSIAEVKYLITAEQSMDDGKSENGKEQLWKIMLLMMVKWHWVVHAYNFHKGWIVITTDE